MFGPERLFDELTAEGLGTWATLLRQRARDANEDQSHGRREAWLQAIGAMPLPAAPTVDASGDCVSIAGQITDDEQTALRECLMQLHPWRKGPFSVYGIDIDTEWRSNLKWDRVAKHLDFSDASVLDVGSGNGYYGWRMIAAGARRVIGLEPFPIYIAQHEAIHRFAPEIANYVTPGTDADIPQRLEAFDIALSMGVLYHRASPIDHLRAMKHSLKRGGRLVLETLIVDSPDDRVLVPENRYAQMRNVWFIPSPSVLQRFLQRCGFRDIELVDVTQTTIREQRSTSWMQFDSLDKFLSPDGTATIEGYPPPTRAIVLATKA